MSKRTSLLMVLGLSLSPGACDCDGPQGPDADLGDGIVEIGTGALAFEELTENQELLLVAGIQGGFHFVVNARMQNMLTGNPEMPGQLGNPITSFIIIRENGERIDARFPPYRLGYQESEEPPWFELPSGRILQIHPDLVLDGSYEELYDELVTLRVEIEDASGETASSEIKVRPLRDMSPDAGLFIDAGVEDAGSPDASLP